MKRRSKIMGASLTAVSMAAFSGIACSPSTSTPPTSCDSFTNYQATVTAAPSFANDIYPILSDISIPSGCGQTGICHGAPSMYLDTPAPGQLMGTKFLQFTFGTKDAPV